MRALSHQLPPFLSSNEWVQGFAIAEGWNFCSEPIETPNMPRMFVDEVAKNAGVHDVVVDDKAAPPVALLHARRDLPPKASASSLLKHMTELHFERSRKHIACTRGLLAEALATRLTGGARTLADALHDWLGSNQAKQLESHLERGHLVLCVELRTPDDFSVVCGRLVQASPHMVELCNINFGLRCRA
jgi:hypothetical protein